MQETPPEPPEATEMEEEKEPEIGEIQPENVEIQPEIIEKTARNCGRKKTRQTQESCT